MVLDDIFSSRKEQQKLAKLSIDARLASPLDRAAAFIADLVILSPLMALALATFRRQAMEAHVLGDERTWMLNLAYAFIAALATVVAYQTFFISLWGATPGKRAFGLRVVSVWSEEIPVPLQAFLRSISWCMELLLLGVPWMAISSNERRRPYHDRIADTVVVGLNPGQFAGPPSLPEMSVASGFQAACLAMMAISAGSFAMQLGSATLGGNRIAMEMEDDGRLCREVREARDEWGGRVPGRLEVAISLFAADSLTEDCLNKEADFALWRNVDKTQAYLAKALAGHDSDLADTYFDKACEPGQDSDACRLAHLARASEEFTAEYAMDTPEDKAEAVERETAAEMSLAKVDSSSAVYLKAWSVRYLIEKRRFTKSLELLDQIPVQPKLGAFFSAQRTKALWNVGQYEHARISLRSTRDFLDTRSRVDLSRWLCMSETNEAGCAPQVEISCGTLSKAIENSSRWLANDGVAIAYIRSETCAAGGSLNETAARKVEEKLEEPAARQYVRALVYQGQGKTQDALKSLRQLAAGRFGQDAYFVEANLRLSELTTSVEDLDAIRSRWQNLEPSDESWLPLGRKLMSAFTGLKSWDRTLQVGLKLATETERDQALYRSLIVAAHRAGQKGVALGLLEKLSSFDPKGFVTQRAPASSVPPSTNGEVSEFETVVAELMSSGDQVGP